MHAGVSVLLSTTILCLGSFAMAASEAASMAEAISGGEPQLQFRYRIESVDQDGFADAALASTLKTRLGYKTAPYNGLTLVLEIDDVSYLGDDDFNNTRNKNMIYPTVADPSGTDINQAFARWDAGAYTFGIGRQRINRDNQRFIGGVGWRQNEQTYDALDMTWSQGSATASYSYVNRVSRIFGPQAGTPDRALDSDSHLINAGYDLGEFGKLSGYGYLLDFDNAATSSSRTIGARWAGQLEAKETAFPITLEYAHQSDYAANSQDYSASYRLVEVGIRGEEFAITLGNEVLEGTPGGAFMTPLATLHKFQGWADKFLSTPRGGVDDRYVGANVTVGGFAITGTLHRFAAESGGVDYGDEFDFSVSRKLDEHFSILFKLADYNADTLSTDATKIWLMLTATF